MKIEDIYEEQICYYEITILEEPGLVHIELTEEELKKEVTVIKRIIPVKVIKINKHVNQVVIDYNVSGTIEKRVVLPNELWEHGNEIIQLENERMKIQEKLNANKNIDYFLIYGDVQRLEEIKDKLSYLKR